MVFLGAVTTMLVIRGKHFLLALLIRLAKVGTRLLN